MKFLTRIRYWLLCLVLALVLGSLFHSLNQRVDFEGGAWQRAAPATAIAEDSTTVLLHFPSINKTGSAYAGADLSRLWQMSAIQDFLANPLGETPEMRAIKPYWERCLELQARDAMLAVSLEGDCPQVLLAFQSNADLAEVWSPARSWLQNKYDDEGSETIEKIGDVTYRFIGKGSSRVVQARWGDWCLTGTDDQAVRQALGRLRTNIKLGSLADSEIFKRAVQTLPRDYLSLSYIDTTKVNIAEVTKESSVGPSEPLVRNVSRLVKTATRADLTAIALTSSIRDGKMIDQATVLVDHSETDPIDPRTATLNLTSPETLAFFTAGIGRHSICDHVLGPYLKHWQESGNDILLAAAAQTDALFAESWSLQLEPIDPTTSSANQNSSESMLLLAFAQRDPEATKTWLARLAEQEHSGVNRTGPDSFTFETSFLEPPATHFITEMHARVEHGLLHLANDSRGLHQVLRRWDLGNISSRTDFRMLARQLPDANAGLGFIDANRVLANGYDTLRHPLVIGTLWMGLRSQTNLEIEFGDLDEHGMPSDFTPTMIALSRMPNGFQQASVGSLSPSQWALGSGLAVALIDKTFLEPLPVDVEESMPTPATETELLRLLEIDR